MANSKALARSLLVRERLRGIAPQLCSAGALRTFGPDSTRRSARGVQSDAANGWRVRVLGTLMTGMIELALRQVPGPPEPVLDHFPHDRGILGWPDAA